MHSKCVEELATLARLDQVRNCEMKEVLPFSVGCIGRSTVCHIYTVYSRIFSRVKNVCGLPMGNVGWALLQVAPAKFASFH